MHQQKPYAIKCTTEEQIKECNSNGFIAGFDNVYNLKDYTIISYDEAISLGLLGEKKCIHKYDISKEEANARMLNRVCVKCGYAEEVGDDDTQKVEPVKECNHSDKCICVHCGVDVKKSPSEDIVEKIQLFDTNLYTIDNISTRAMVRKINEIIKVVNKLLSSK